MHTKEIKKRLKLSNALIIVFGIMVLAMVLTWNIPAGQYDTLPDSTVLDPATVIMPIMAPLADVVGVTRQAAVTAFQLGDGLSNVIFPTSGTLMGTIAIILVVASGVA